MVKVSVDEDLDGTPFRFLNGRFDKKVSSAETSGAMCVFDTVRSAPGGPPLHVHADQDEWFLVTEGQFDVRVGDTTYRLTAGDSVLGPRGIPHAFANVSKEGRILVVFTPAGSMEAFFQSGSDKGPMSPEEFASHSERHGMTVVGPPLFPPTQS